MVRGGGKRRLSPPHPQLYLPSLDTHSSHPAVLTTLVSSRSSACIQMGLLSPGEKKGAVTSLPYRPLLVGLDIELGSGEGVRGSQEESGLGFVE